jgi:hypothetical protein
MKMCKRLKLIAASLGLLTLAWAATAIRADGEAGFRVKYRCLEWQTTYKADKSAANSLVDYLRDLDFDVRKTKARKGGKVGFTIEYRCTRWRHKDFTGTHADRKSTGLRNALTALHCECEVYPLPGHDNGHPPPGTQPPPKQPVLSWFLGVKTSPDTITLYNKKKRTVLRVNNVAPKSPAAKAGLQPGDLLWQAVAKPPNGRRAVYPLVSNDSLDSAIANSGGHLDLYVTGRLDPIPVQLDPQQPEFRTVPSKK